jgi:SAM-dependent methyltransferase
MRVMSKVHSADERGFGRSAESYSLGRPGYPPAVLDWLRDDLGLKSGKIALELGAGTGKFTRMLVRTNAEVVAVEPVDAMLALLVRDLPDVRALRATAQRIPLANASVDAVICAQAFHWFASPEALAEIRRVLVPGGVLGLLWNVRDQSTGWVAELTRILQPYEGDAPRYDHGEWRQPFPAPGFGELRERTIAHAHIGPAEQVIVERVASTSFIASMDSASRSRVLERVRDLVARTPELAGRGDVSHPYVAHMYWTSAC